MIFHISIHGCDRWNGTEDKPFRSISKAAQIALPGDTVKIHAGVYREWVSPANGGTEDHRIVYEAAGDGEVVISGAEIVTDWTEEEPGVWRTSVPNTLFTYRNPFDTPVYGDWLFADLPVTHLGQVYLNGKSLYERSTLEEVKAPTPWSEAKYPEDSLLAWCCKVDDTCTTIWANFGKADPRKECVEINVRPFCFWPEKTGRNYITVRGLTLRQASPQWAPPTALQEGLIGPHWSKGWIIENNKITESTCCGISLGKEISTGQNEWSDLKFKFGTQREQEVIFRALHCAHWDKEHIGSHTVRYNEISECEQCGIVGHLGAVFSEIYGNRIHHIHHKNTYHGAEVSGIKLHASLDVNIHHNVFYSCYRAVWFDWQAQGTHLHHNLCLDSRSEDLFVEVCHGPYTVDHNLFLSPVSFRNLSQGGAFVHNLFAGRIVINPDRGRMTPYHFPHETAVAGYTNIIGGDDRYYQNVFLRDDDSTEEPLPMGFFEHLPLPERSPEELEADKQAKMDGLPTKNNATLYPVGLRSYDDYPGPDDKFWEKPFSPKLFSAHLPNWIKNNLYLNSARPSVIDEGALEKKESGIQFQFAPDCSGVTVTVDPKVLRGLSTVLVTSDLLGKSYHAEERFEEPDGSAYVFDHDYFGNVRPAQNPMPGPFEIAGDAPVTFEL